VEGALLEGKLSPRSHHHFLNNSGYLYIIALGLRIYLGRRMAVFPSVLRDATATSLSTFSEKLGRDGRRSKWEAVCNRLLALAKTRRVCIPVLNTSFLSILQLFSSVIWLSTCREYVPKDVENGLNLLQPEVDCSHSPPSFSPSQSSTIKETTSNLRISRPHSLCYESSPVGPADPFYVQTLHESVSNSPMGYPIPPFTSSAFDSSPLPLEFSNTALSESGYPAYLGSSSCAPFNWEQNCRNFCPDSNNLITSPFSFGDSGVYEFSTPTESLLSSVYPVPLL
jgi:hypothetical protein